jgi:integrase
MPRRKPKRHAREWGEGSIQELPNGRFRAWAPRTADGKHPSKVCATRVEALAWIASHVSGGPVPGVLVLGDYLERWYAKLLPTLRPQSAALYRAAITAAEPLSLVPLAELTEDDWQGLWNALLDHGKVVWRWEGRVKVDTGKRLPLARATVDRRRGVLSSAMNAAVPRYIPANPIRKTRLPAPDERIPKAWRRDEIARLLVAAHGTRDEALYYVGLDCGLRLGELRGLRWDDLDVVDRKLRVERSTADSGATVGPTKTRKSRVLTLPPETVAILVAHQKRQPPGETLMFGHGGRPYASHEIRRMLRLVCTKAGVRPLTPHSLRHTCASILLADRVPLPDVARRLGHANTQVTARVYAHQLSETEHESVQAIRAVLYGATDSPGDVVTQIVTRAE